jgi:hypothetical protein
MQATIVLIYYILYAGGSITSGTQEFKETALCQKAISELIRMEEESNSKNKEKLQIKAICVEK